MDGPRLSGVDALYTDGDSDVPEPLDSAEMEGGEPDEPQDTAGVFATRKKRILKKGNLIVQRKIKDMYDENLLYSETMQLLLDDKNTKFMYQGYDQSLIEGQNIRDIQQEFDLEEDEFDDLQKMEVYHQLAEQPNPTPHMYYSSHLNQKQNLD